jgi:glucose/mannose transport system permease protein
MVTLIWQFTNIWNDFLFGVAFSGADSKPDHRGPEQHGEHHQQREKLQRRHGCRHHRGPCRPCWCTSWPASTFVKGLTAGAVKG